jgi:hypothetical protein
METLRLRRIQEPASVEKLLTDFVARSELIPRNCYEIRDLAELSPPLQRLVSQEIERGRPWACRANALSTWLFTCEMLIAASRERGTPVLEVSLYGDTGELQESGSWLLDPHDNWQRCDT